MESGSDQVKSPGSIAKQSKPFQMSPDGPFEVSEMENETLKRSDRCYRFYYEPST